MGRGGRFSPATPRNRSLSKSAFPGSPQDRRFQRRQQKEIGRAIGKTIEFFMLMIMFCFIAVIAGAVFIVSALFLILGFLVKIIYRTIRLKIKKQKLTKEIFSKTKFEEGCMKGVFASQRIFQKGTSQFGKDLHRMDKKSHRQNFYGDDEERGRYCEVCGGRLGKGRVKYCSQCRPTYRSTPFEDDY